MPIYNAPVEEMMFLFDHLKDNKNYKEIDKYKEINSDLVNVLAHACSKDKKKFIHISTDHFYVNDKKKLHSETDEIKIVNNYAMTKRIGELNALRFEDALVVRTNITGIRIKDLDEFGSNFQKMDF